MRAGWSLKAAAAVLDIHERRVTQSLDPTLERMAKLWRADPTKTMLAMLEAVERLGPMTDRELDLRIRIGKLRADTAEAFPAKPIPKNPTPARR